MSKAFFAGRKLRTAWALYLSSPMKPACALLFLPLLFMACKKDSPVARNELLTGEWTLKAEGYDQNGDNLLQNSEIDTPAAGSQIFEVYRADGTGDYIVRLRGKTDDIKSPFKWFLTDGEKNLQRVRGIDTSSFKILKLEANRMERYDPLQNPKLLQILEK